MLDTLQDRLTDSLRSTGGSTLMVVVGIMLLLLLGSQLYTLISALSFSPEVKTVTKVTPLSVSSDYNASIITQQNLFGRTSATTNQQLGSNLPITDLSIVLRGAFTSSVPEQASALIEGQDGNTRVYKVDSIIYGQTRLHRVFADRVVLNSDGNLETLYFPNPEDVADTMDGNNMSAENSAEDLQQLVQNTMSTDEIRTAARELSSKSMTAEQRKALIRERLMELRQRAREKRENNQ